MSTSKALSMTSLPRCARRHRAGPVQIYLSGARARWLPAQHLAGRARTSEAVGPPSTSEIRMHHYRSLGRHDWERIRIPGGTSRMSPPQLVASRFTAALLPDQPWLQAGVEGRTMPGEAFRERTDPHPASRPVRVNQRAHRVLSGARTTAGAPAEGATGLEADGIRWPPGGRPPPATVGLSLDNTSYPASSTTVSSAARGAPGDRLDDVLVLNHPHIQGSFTSHEPTGRLLSRRLRKRRTW